MVALSNNAADYQMIQYPTIDAIIERQLTSITKENVHSYCNEHFVIALKTN